MKLSWLLNILGSRNINKGIRSGKLEARIVQRKVLREEGLFKVLDRDRFYGRHYHGKMNRMALIDISTTGCAFRAELEIPKGSFLEIELKKLGEGLFFDPPMSASCEAIYTLPLAGNAKRIGAKFLEIDQAHIEKIRRFTE